MSAVRPLLVTLALASATSAQAGTFLRTHDDVVVPGRGTVLSAPAVASLGTDPCSSGLIARHGQVLGTGGTLSPLAFANPACINRNGVIAFVASVSGVSRNQGVFVADASGVRAIAMGCGQGGGSGQHGTCGDPSPIGGTFAGFFGGTVTAPPINDAGDVLFVCDVLVGGASRRGLFLFRAATQTIVKVAAVGDASPIGGTFTAIGPGSLNNFQEVAFLAINSGRTDSEAFHWSNGTVTKIVAAGDPAPGGGVVAIVGSERFGFADGTQMPAGPVPAINDCSQLAFRLIVTNGITSRGIVVRTAGVDRWYLKAGDPAPSGGTFIDFQGAALNGGGRIAVLGDISVGSTYNTGWFVGEPGSFRRAVAFYDIVDGGSCLGLAYSRNPMTPLDDQGNLLFWCNLSSQGDQDRLAVSAADGSLSIVARRGDPTPIGGTFGTMNAWPSMSVTGRTTVSVAAPASIALNAHFVTTLCGPAVAASACAPIGGSLRLDDYGPPGASFGLLLSTTVTNMPIPPFGTLLIGPSPLWTLVGPTPYPAPTLLHTTTLPIPNLPVLASVQLHFQSLAIGAPTDQLTNRATTTLR
ncbi:MAG: hypothetical protein IPM29_08155 [Planctomycetes bacterium]|nr:hypothetical protein [Planctomycetota bacterium]